jgi:hypothetical protein
MPTIPRNKKDTGASVPKPKPGTAASGGSALLKYATMGAVVMAADRSVLVPTNACPESVVVPATVNRIRLTADPVESVVIRTVAHSDTESAAAATGLRPAASGSAVGPPSTGSAVAPVLPSGVSGSGGASPGGGAVETPQSAAAADERLSPPPPLTHDPPQSTADDLGELPVCPVSVVDPHILMHNANRSRTLTQDQTLTNLLSPTSFVPFRDLPSTKVPVASAGGIGVAYGAETDRVPSTVAAAAAGTEPVPGVAAAKPKAAAAKPKAAAKPDAAAKPKAADAGTVTATGGAAAAKPKAAAAVGGVIAAGAAVSGDTVTVSDANGAERALPSTGPVTSTVETVTDAVALNAMNEAMTTVNHDLSLLGRSSGGTAPVTGDVTSPSGADDGPDVENQWTHFNAVTSIMPTTVPVTSTGDNDTTEPSVGGTVMDTFRGAMSGFKWFSGATPQAVGNGSGPTETEGGGPGAARIEHAPWFKSVTAAEETGPVPVTSIVETGTHGQTTAGGPSRGVLDDVFAFFDPDPPSAEFAAAAGLASGAPHPPDEPLPSGFLPNLSTAGGLLAGAPAVVLAKWAYDFDRRNDDVRVDDVDDDYGTDVDGTPDGPTLIAEMRRSVLMYARLAASTDVVDRWEAAGAGRVAVRWVADSGDVRVAWWTLPPSGDADGVVPAEAGPQGALVLRLIKGRAYDPRASRYAVRLRVRSDGPHRGKYLCLRPRADADGGGARVAAETPRPENPSDHARFRWFVAASPPASGAAAEGPSVRRVILYNGHQNLDPPHWFVSGVSPARDGVTADTTDAVGPPCVALVLGDAEPAAGDVF